MRRRPRSITAAGVIFVVVGCGSLAGGVRGFLADGAGPDAVRDLAWVALSGLSALAGGVGVLLGRSSARWVLVAWMAGHVVLSLMHSTFEVVAHVLIFSGVLLLLFRPSASAYLRRER